jgi:hypothetical protein
MHRMTNLASSVNDLGSAELSAALMEIKTRIITKILVRRRRHFKSDM